MKKLIPLIVLTSLIISCKTGNLMRQRITGWHTPNTVGLVVRFNEGMDTTIITPTFKETLTECNYTVLDGFFTNGIYEKANFWSLFHVDSTFILQQKTLLNLQQIIVADIYYTLKEEKDKGTSIGLSCLAKWIHLHPIEVKAEFYYVEIIKDPANIPADKQRLKGFVATQIHLKLCYEIETRILNKK